MSVLNERITVALDHLTQQRLISEKNKLNLNGALTQKEHGGVYFSADYFLYLLLEALVKQGQVDVEALVQSVFLAQAAQFDRDLLEEAMARFKSMLNTEQ